MTAAPKKPTGTAPSWLLESYADGIAESLDALEAAIVVAEDDASEAGGKALWRARKFANRIRHDLAGMRADAAKGGGS